MNIYLWEHFLRIPFLLFISANSSNVLCQQGRRSYTHIWAHDSRYVRGELPSSSSFFSSSSMFSSSSPPPVVGGNYSPHQHPSHRAMWSSCEKRKELLSFWFRLAACTAINWITCADILTLELIRWLSCWKYNVSGSKKNTCKDNFF